MAKRHFLCAVKAAAAISICAAVISSFAGCAVVAVADAAVTVVATGVKVTAKTIGAAADLVLPSSDKKTDKATGKEDAKK